MSNKGFFERRIDYLEDYLKSNLVARNLEKLIKRPDLPPEIKAEIGHLLPIKVINECMKGPAKVFYLNDVIADSLYNEKRTNSNYEKSFKLPFPFIFVEFENPLEIKAVDGKDKLLGGILYCKLNDYYDFENNAVFEKLGAKIPYDAEKNKHKFRMVNFLASDSMSGKNFCLEEITFDSTKEALFSFNCDQNYRYEKGNLKVLNKESYFKNYKEAYRVVSEKKENKILNFFNKFNFFKKEELKQENKENAAVKEAIDKRLDLIVNIVNYMNAQNNYITKESRKIQGLDKINKKRASKGKELLSALKPYHIVRVKKNYTHSEKSKEGKDWDLNWRVWVRGHFRHYQDGKCVWIEPYKKGPENAPWKENRYQVLYEKYQKLR